MTTRFRVPHTLVLLFAMMLLAWAATWVLPAGEFATAVDAQGHERVVAGSYQRLEEPPRLGPLSVFTVVPRALADAQGIIFFVLLVGGALGVLRASGALDAAIGGMLRRFGHRPEGLIAAGVLVFALASSVLGTAAEYIALVPILVVLCRALGLDALAAVAIMLAGYGVGYAAAMLNPFTVLLAQDIAGLRPFSGSLFRVGVFVLMYLAATWQVLRYARAVMADPTRSLLPADADAAPAAPAEYPAYSGRHRVVLAVTVLALGLIVYGLIWQGWYLVELGATFVALAIAIGLIGGLGVDRTARVFTEGAAALTGTALLIGFARSIALLLEDGAVLHTIVNALASPLGALGAEVAAVGMLVIQSLLNLFIPSGSGQAYVTMPLMAPIADLVGVSRQVAVLAYQFGDGLANLIVPTNIVLMAVLGAAGVPYTSWLRFALPLLAWLYAIAALALIVAVWIGYQ